MADLFEQFDDLFRHRSVVSPPHPVVVNRFLASDRDFAEVAAVVMAHTWDPEFTWEIWRNVVPRLPKAPHMRYTTAKKVDSDPLLVRIMLTYHCKQDEAEALVEMFGAPSLRTYFGIEEVADEAQSG